MGSNPLNIQSLGRIENAQRVRPALSLDALRSQTETKANGWDKLDKMYEQAAGFERDLTSNKPTEGYRANQTPSLPIPKNPVAERQTFADAAQRNEAAQTKPKKSQETEAPAPKKKLGVQTGGLPYRAGGFQGSRGITIG